MDKEKFRLLAKQLGLQTGAELEKIIEFKGANPTKSIGEENTSSAFACEKNATLQTALSNKQTSADSKADLSANSLYINSSDQKQNANKKDNLNSSGVLNEFLKSNAYFALPSGYKNKYEGKIAPLQISAEKALYASIKILKRVDIEYIAALSGISLKQAILSLEGLIFKDPSYNGSNFYEGYVHKDEYLSGNVVQKLKLAMAKEKNSPGLYKANVRALSKIIPPKPKFGEFYVGLGSPWIPAGYVADFVQYLYRMTLLRDRRICEVVYESSVHRWTVVLNFDVKNTIIASKTYGTERMDMFKILEKTLNHEQIRITDSGGGTDKKGRVLNREQTMLAEEKRSVLKQSFLRWLTELDESKKQELCDIYQEKVCYFSKRKQWAQITEFSDLNPQISLYDYQKQAVSRIIANKCTLLAHDVGAGKTYAMIVSAHELSLRRGYKNLIAVPNSIISQWEDDYKLLYPNAKVLCVHPEDFAPAKREECLNNIANGDYESVIMAYSTLELIKTGEEYELWYCNKKLAEVEGKIRENQRRRPIVRNKLDAVLVKWRTHYFDRKYQLERAIASKNELNFDDLRFDTVFLDEAHNYKNLPLESSLGTVKGLNVEGSSKCSEIYYKTRSVLKHGGKLIFATGTPITNSVADAFVMQKYLQESELAQADLDYFDNWAGVFGEITRSYEIDVDTENYRLTTRFNRFNNLTLLSDMINCFTDFHVVGQDGLPTLDRVQTIVVEKTQSQKDLLKEISSRVEKIRLGEVDRKTDNLLKVTTDGRKLALDSRLVTGQYEFDCGNKILQCAKTVSKIYFEMPGKTQLVFCDIGTPKTQFNVYDELKSVLVSLGMPAESIGFVHDATSDLKRAKMFESVNNGTIAVLIGSTFKLGTGVNVQERLVALHHLDVPWRPSDMVQREGRLIRRGNTNEKVYIFRYVTEGSFDAYSWQLLENKQRFITELLTGTAEGVSEQKLDDAVLGYAEVKALAIGNPLLKTRIELVNEIARLKTLQREEDKKNESIVEMVRTLPELIEGENERLRALKVDVKNAEKNYEIADKQLIAQLISFATSQNEGDLNESVITEIGDFLIILPASFSRARPYLIIQGEGRYTLDLVTFGMGAVTKLENFFKSLAENEKVVSQRLAGYEMQLREAEQELSNKASYLQKIKELTQKLKEVDEQMGI